jgi:Domain of unknown function (DUF5348)
MAMKQREDRLVLGPDDQYILRGLHLEEGDSLDIRVGNTWISGYVHYEESDGNWYCDSGIMSIPLYDGREARSGWRWSITRGVERTIS